MKAGIAVVSYALLPNPLFYGDSKTELLTTLCLAMYTAQDWEMNFLSVLQMSCSCSSVNKTHRSNSVYFSSKFMLFIVYSLAFNRAGIDCSDFATAVILDRAHK